MGTIISVVDKNTPLAQSVLYKKYRTKKNTHCYRCPKLNKLFLSSDDCYSHAVIRGWAGGSSSIIGSDKWVNHINPKSSHFKKGYLRLNINSGFEFKIINVLHTKEFEDSHYSLVSIPLSGIEIFNNNKEDKIIKSTELGGIIDYSYGVICCLEDGIILQTNNIITCATEYLPLLEICKQFPIKTNYLDILNNLEMEMHTFSFFNMNVYLRIYLQKFYKNQPIPLVLEADKLELIS